MGKRVTIKPGLVPTAYTARAHTHIHARTHAYPHPVQQFISTCPHSCIHTLWSLPAEKGTFFIPHHCVHTQASLGNGEALELFLQLSMQAHTLSPTLNKNSLTSMRGGKKATLCSERRQLPDVGKLCFQCLLLSVYLLSLSSPSPLRMAQEREVRGEIPPHPHVHV